MSDLLNWLPGELQSLADEGLLRQRREVQPIPDGRRLVDDHPAWDFASNDYLGLASHPEVIRAAAEAVHSHGVGAQASPLIAGRSDLHIGLELALADFERTEGAILFPTGMAANIGTVAALAGTGDAVFCDRLNHASLVDGCRLSGARLRVYRHDDLEGLDAALSREEARRKFIVTDSVFSMDGDLAPMPELCDLSERHGAALILDEAHGTGVFGPDGRGVAEFYDVEDRVSVRIGTLSKAIGTLGGFVAGSHSLINFLWNKARTQIYSTALPPAICAAAMAAIQVIQRDPSRRLRLQAMAKAFRDQLQQAGISPVKGSIGPIVPIVLHDPRAAMRVAEGLLSDGFLVGAIRPPTVPHGTSRLRITLHSELPQDVVTKLANRLAEHVHAVTRGVSR